MNPIEQYINQICAKHAEVRRDWIDEQVLKLVPEDVYETIKETGDRELAQSLQIDVGIRKRTDERGSIVTIYQHGEVVVSRDFPFPKLDN